jgi:hypothetical protein
MSKNFIREDPFPTSSTPTLSFDLTELENVIVLHLFVCRVITVD